MVPILPIVLACHFLAAFTVLGVPLFLPALLRGFHIAPASPWIGLLYTLPTVVMALSAPFWGRFADRYGCRLSLQRALLGLTLAFVLAGAAPSLPWLIMALFLQGLAGGTLAAANGYLYRHYPGEALAHALNWTQFSARLALLSAPPLLGLALGQDGIHAAQTLWLWLALLPLAGLLLSLGLPDDQHVHHATPSALPKRRGRASPSSAPADYGILLTLQFLFSFAMVTTFPYFLPYAQGWVRQPALIGVLYSWPHLLYLLLLPMVQRTRATRRPLAWGLGMLALSALWQGHLTTIAALLAARTLFGLGMLMTYIGLNRHIATRLRDHDAAYRLAQLDASAKWAGVAAGLCAAGLSARFSPAAPFIASAAAALAALALCLLFPFKEPCHDYRCPDA
ncbi:MFS transporter [Edwardsiella tarda]|uniref:MFS transporter n=1 Tax=Edwardsiella tarda TaxID=636 RepID=UPI00063BDD58|nr:MFS transporter [Edwardsiella tarda]AKH88905.1 MFS transporter [Edwardsiella tarda]